MSTELSTRQKEAIRHAGRNLQLIACAGSGKTEVVARRVVHLPKLASEPFPVRDYQRIAVEVVDVYGNESAIVRDLPS